jgi:tRNA-specific 2-thiouridylase
MSRIAVAMSGGVDSSVAALLLHERGAEVIGLTMQLVDAGGAAKPASGRCCGPRDRVDARAAADAIGIPFYVLNMEEEFRRDVIAPFAAAYRAGRTPVPCADCNAGPKFRHLLERAGALGAGHLATGHYARIDRDGRTGALRLLAAADRRRDQSYFLHALRQEQLERLVFPVGDLTKSAVRALALARGLPNAAKPDSQDLCFVPDGGYLAIVRREGSAGPAGEIVSTSGERLGRHEGIAGFTIGQRHGLGLADHRAWYVVDIDPDSGRVTVGAADEQARATLVAGSMSWVAGAPPGVSFAATARIRSSHAGAACRVRVLDGDRIAVRFEAAQRAVTPGQAVVLYAGDEVLGGGTIARSVRRAVRDFDSRANAMLESRAEGRA